MAEIFGPFRDIPKGAGVFQNASPLSGLFKGGSMIPIPSFTGGASGPAFSDANNTGGNIGPVNFGGNNFKSSNWLTYAVIGAVIIIGLRVWRK